MDDSWILTTWVLTDLLTDLRTLVLVKSLSRLKIQHEIFVSNRHDEDLLSCFKYSSQEKFGEKEKPIHSRKKNSACSIVDLKV